MTRTPNSFLLCFWLEWPVDLSSQTGDQTQAHGVERAQTLNEPLAVAAWSLYETLLTVAHQAPPSLGFSRQEHWSGLPFRPPGTLPNPGIELTSPALAVRFFITEPPGKSLDY